MTEPRLSPAQTSVKKRLTRLARAEPNKITKSVDELPRVGQNYQPTPGDVLLVFPEGRYVVGEDGDIKIILPTTTVRMV